MDVYYQSDKGTAGSLDDTEKQVVFVKEELSMIFVFFFFTQRHSLRRRNSILNLICTLVSWSLPQWCKSRASAGSERIQVQHHAFNVLAPPRFQCVPPIHVWAASSQFHLLPFSSYYMDESRWKKTRQNTKQHSLAMKQRTHLPQCCIKSCI